MRQYSPVAGGGKACKTESETVCECVQTTSLTEMHRAADRCSTCFCFIYSLAMRDPPVHHPPLSTVEAASGMLCALLSCSLLEL